MVSVDCMLISILSVLVEALEISCPEAAKALALWAWDLKPDDMLNLICKLRNPNLSCIQF